MFCGFNELKGFIIDADSLNKNEIAECIPLFANKNVIFITSDARIFSEYSSPEIRIYIYEPFRRHFIPNSSVHKKLLKLLGVNTTDMCYISKDIELLNNAMNFLCLSVWISEKITYEEVSTSPDIICKNLSKLKQYLQYNVGGFYGEVSISPQYNKQTTYGVIVPVEISVDQKKVQLFVLGRYFGYSHYRNQIHPYSNTIYYNKKVGSKINGLFNQDFTRLYLRAVERIIQQKQIYGICSVPAKIGADNRFAPILNEIAQRYNLIDLSTQFICTKEYNTQKSLPETDRIHNVEGVFQFNGNLTGKSIILIDDIITTGATIKSCIKALEAAGANSIEVIVLAVNQWKGTYWSNEIPQVTCDICSEKMRLRINSESKKYFYFCSNCNNKSGIDFEKGLKRIQDKVNSEFTYFISSK